MLVLGVYPGIHCVYLGELQVATVNFVSCLQHDTELTVDNLEMAVHNVELPRMLTV